MPNTRLFISMLCTMYSTFFYEDIVVIINCLRKIFITFLNKGNQPYSVFLAVTKGLLWFYDRFMHLIRGYLVKTNYTLSLKYFSYN